MAVSVRSVATLNAVTMLEEAGGVRLAEEVGKGSYSSVKRAWSRSLNRAVAVKMIDRRSGSDFVRRFLPRELAIVKELRHPNVVRVYQVVDAGHIVCLVEELAQNGDLLQRIKALRRVPEAAARPIFRQLVEALSYLRSIQIVHRDIKCENIFLDQYDNVKLGDFGFARRMRRTDVSWTFCGSRGYCAPELLRSRPYTGFTVDIWAAGIVLYVTVTGLMPYDDRHTSAMLHRQLSHRVIFDRHLDASPDVRLLVYDMLHPDPEQRATLDQIKDSAWLRNTPYRLRTADATAVVQQSTAAGVPALVDTDDDSSTQ